MKGDCQNDVEVAKNDDVEVAVLHKRDLLDEPQRGWSTAAVADIETVSGGRQLQRGVGCRHRFVRTLLLRAIVESWYTSAVRLVLIPDSRGKGVIVSPGADGRTTRSHTTASPPRRRR